jgi:predicted transcriptional regulator
MHNGETVELVIRRDNISISELSRRLNVSRRSVYNWFAQENLSVEIICKIGEVLNHDFSKDFPSLFNDADDRVIQHNFRDVGYKDDASLNSAQYWRDKYINLLEKHNDFLSRSARIPSAV